MLSNRSSGISKRTFLTGTSAAAAALLLPLGRTPAARPVQEMRLVVVPARVSLLGPGAPDTSVWSFSGQVPGPQILLRRGDRLRAVVENRMEEGTTVHWHGVRVPNAMDGVPYLTQMPIEPGTSFTYEFDVPDSGTYWYHPHQRSVEQVGRGLYGPLIVEDDEPIRLDRDVTWILDDWRLTAGGAIRSDFYDEHDLTTTGRLGNTVTLNGRVPEAFRVRAGERIRLRLINAANARIFALHFEEHSPWIIALDGQAVEPHEPGPEGIVLGPAMRTDIVIDMRGRPGDRHGIVDRFLPASAYKVLDIAYDDRPPLRNQPLDAPIRLAGNDIEEPDLHAAERHKVVFDGGAGSGLMRRMIHGTASERARIRNMFQQGLVWTINGVATKSHTPDPMLTLRSGQSFVLEMQNDTTFHHPIHLHGHFFRVIARNGKPTQFREWRDTVNTAPGERVDIAFVAGKPGDWMFHCHILEHQEAGMMSVVRVI